MKSRTMAATAVANVATGIDQPSLALPEEEIARLAYSYWENRGCQGGSPEEDWFRAEEELKAKTSTDGR